MSKPRKNRKGAETEAKGATQVPVAPTAEPPRMKTPVEPRVANEESMGRASLSPIALGAIMLSIATLIAVVILSSNINAKLEKKASVEQMDKLTAHVSRLSKLLEENLKHNQEAIASSIKASRLDQRAWVGVKSIQMLPMEAGKPLKMEIKFSNSGKTFALDVRYTGILRLSDKFLGDVAPEDRENLEKQPKQVPTLVTLAPGGESLMPCASLAPLTDEMIAAINTGKVYVYLVGEISYTDVFKAWHTTRFFQRYVPAEQKFLAEPAHNDAD